MLTANDRCNFIVGQITPDMLSDITYGTYLIFGALTFLGAGFMWFFVPETKRLTLEEMDVVFGSVGTAQADFERMEEINQEIGLTSMILAHGSPAAENPKLQDEKEELPEVEHE